LPLVFIIIVTAVKDFFEDYKRKKSDQEENDRLNCVFDPAINKFVTKK